MSPPISKLASQALIAFTIEVDNEFETRLQESGERVRVSSLTMWFNFLRYVGEGIKVGDLPDAAGLQKARMLSTVGGMERWGYVRVGPTGRRDGYGSARALKADWVVEQTSAGHIAAEVWPRLVGEVEERWVERFGRSTATDLIEELTSFDSPVDVRLPDFPPILGSANGLRVDLPVEARDWKGSPQLVCLLARALLAYTVGFEKRSGHSLALWANVVRLLENPTPVKELPERGGISREAANVAMTVLRKAGLATVEGNVVCLTDPGQQVRSECQRAQAALDDEWSGNGGLGRVLNTVVEGPLVQGLRPHPNGWRSRKPYLARTEAMLARPTEVLPHYPMVLHRGGWPDGS